MNYTIKKIRNLLDKFDFMCKNCSLCCRIDPGAVFLTEDDIKNMYTYLSLSKKQFLSQYCREILRNGKIIFSLKEKSNYDCVFWNKNCLIYKVRPLQCKTYPFWPSIVKSKTTWKEESKKCKGMNKKGNLTTEEKLSLYIQEKEAIYGEKT